MQDRNLARASVIAAIEAGSGVQDAAAEYDIDAIIDAAYKVDSIHGYVQVAAPDEFWAAVEANVNN